MRAPSFILLTLALPLLCQSNLLELGELIYCTTHRSPLDFDCYGCWCGFGGEGDPFDEIDACCRIHDHCYDDAAANNCTLPGETYTIPYRFHCKKSGQYDNGQQASILDQILQDPSDNYAECSTFNRHLGQCAETMCACDTALANCLAQNIDAYPSEKPRPPQGTCPKRHCKLI